MHSLNYNVDINTKSAQTTPQILIKLTGHHIALSNFCAWGMSYHTDAIEIEQGLTSPPTQYRLYKRRFFTGQKTQPTVSKY